MRVHPRAVLPEDRLGHEGREKPMSVGDVADNEPERREVVGGLERLGVAEVDLVLAGRDLVMPRLDLEPHESLDRRAVEHDVALERLLELALGHLDVLVDAQDIRELEPQEADPLLLADLEEVALGGAGGFRGGGHGLDDNPRRQNAAKAATGLSSPAAALVALASLGQTSEYKKNSYGCGRNAP